MARLDPIADERVETREMFKLIDGVFTGSDAAQVLLSLVRSKIDFHSMEKFSNEERFGADVAHSEHRMAQLRELHETLKVLCQSAEEQNQKLKIDGWIEVTRE